MGFVVEKLHVCGEEEDAFFFDRSKDQNEFLSVWSIAPFELDGHSFTSVLQYILHRRCVICNDKRRAIRLLSIDDPEKQIALAYERNSDYLPYLRVWEGLRQLSAYRANMAKYTQNRQLRDQLLKTESAILAKCSDNSRTWSCGLGLGDASRLDIAQWKGSNMMGFTLMAVRDEIRRRER